MAKLGLRANFEGTSSTSEDMANQLPDVDMLHIGKDSLHERVYLTLRKALMSGRFRPGQRLLLKPLADDLGISITPVREALQRLVSEHGLIIARSRTIIVPLLSVSCFREIRDIRIELEGRAIEAATKKITSAEIDEFEEIHHALLQRRTAGDMQGALAHNQDLHFQLYQKANLPVLLSLIEGLWVRTGPLLTCLEDYTDSVSLHEHPHVAMLAALRSKDSAAARIALANDIMWASRYLEQAVVKLNDQAADQL